MVDEGAIAFSKIRIGKIILPSRWEAVEREDVSDF